MDWDTLWLTPAPLIALAGASLLAWALIGDRSRGRRRCPRCWYDMSVTDGRRCPECGREARSEKKLLKSRRRWRWAFVSGLLLLLAVAFGVTGMALRDGWESVTPSTVLVLIAQWSDDPWALRTIDERVVPTQGGFPTGEMHFDRLWQWQWQWLAGRAIELTQDTTCDPLLRESAMRSLVHARSGGAQLDAETVIRSFSVAAQDPNPRLRSCAVILVPFFGDATLKLIVPMLVDADASVRQSAVAGLRLRAHWSREALAHLISALDNDDERVREAAAAFLGSTQSPEAKDAVDALVRTARADKSDRVRGRALRSLGSLAEQRTDVRELILEGASDPSGFVRGDSIIALHAMRVDPEVMGPIVLKALADESSDVRYYATFPLQDPFYRAQIAKHRDELRGIMEDAVDGSDELKALRRVLRELDGGEVE